MSWVNALRIRRRLRRQRRHVATIAAVVALVGALAAHHSAILMGMHHHDADMGAAVELCLGVFTAVGAALVAVGLAVVALWRRRLGRTLPRAGAVRVPGVPVARARHGPAAVSVLCVSRR